MANKPDVSQYRAWAARARAQYAEATTATARAIHHEQAEYYDDKAAGAVADLPDPTS
ncbi:hypothetical protein QH494_11890 [Sphingomonas sp. AR_OL41]|uniref:hypothetical protein n=1 Tax=Sphingomonas sp. AR_OL41 TaxID=3042729 RepID=UPI002480DCC4|nr:hypothetical protein [Sphingomonas sp. AR_OL41]MDH7972888.1 hypothetical protein [Sphingomonas sp. AR_OL41]